MAIGPEEILKWRAVQVQREAPKDRERERDNQPRGSKGRLAMEAVQSIEGIEAEPAKEMKEDTVAVSKRPVTWLELNLQIQRSAEDLQQTTVNNSSGRLTNDYYAIISAWLSNPSNYSFCFGKPGSTTVGQLPASKENGFNLMLDELNKKTKSGLHLTSKQMKDRFKTYQSQYGKAKKESSSTGFGLTEEYQSKVIITISQKLNLMCPCYEQMDHIFGSLQIVNPLGGGDCKQHTWTLPQTTNETLNSDIITNDIIVPPLATPINSSKSQKTSNSWNLNPNSHQKTSKSALPPTTYAELYKAKTDCELDYESGHISWEREKWSKESELRMKQKEVKKELEYKKLEYAKEEKDNNLVYAREEKEKDCELKLLLAEKEKEALKRKEDRD
ncbi:hypothetical protein PPACK8108_LOCUS24261 [Phakopsora pachyrhizi]|uniref:Uncharacterized protein n=1 Tax=Phakopsora pachyrhizi TaxID=170000 RepID=A0AAV0BR88_PHAPC|nr:hypothetical protein PPACK8108_LOCUS24261 [Phakopsora pachyrhizi]